MQERDEGGERGFMFTKQKKNNRHKSGYLMSAKKKHIFHSPHEEGLRTKQFMKLCKFTSTTGNHIEMMFPRIRFKEFQALKIFDIITLNKKRHLKTIIRGDL